MMDDGLQYLIDTFGDQHDIRFVPSVLLGGGFVFRVTIIAGGETYSNIGISYISAFNKTLDQIIKDNK